MNRKQFNLWLRHRWALLVLGWCLISATGTTRGNTFLYLNPGMPAPEFELNRFSGGSASLKESLGSPVLVIVFWASWSERAQEELANLEGMFTGMNLPSGQLVVLGINVEAQVLSESRRDSLRVLVQELKITFPQFWDDGLAYFSQCGVVAVPSTLILDSEGIIRVTLNGYSQQTRMVLEDSIKALLGLLPAKASLIAEAGYIPQEKSRLQFNLGMRMLRLGKYEQARDQFQRTCEIDSGFVPPRLSLGEIQEKLGDIPAAQEAYQRALELDPNCAQALWRLGVIAHRKGETKAAYEFLTQALEKDEDLYLARLERAEVDLEQGELEKAQSEIEEAAKSNPNAPQLAMVRALLAQKRGDLPAGVNILRRVIEQLLHE